MSDKLSVLFYISASNNIGLGHLVRCNSLAAATTLPDCNPPYDIEFTFAAEDTELAKEVTGEFYTVISPSEAILNSYDITICDYLELSLKKQHALKSNCKLLVGINDSDHGPFAFDMLLRPNVLGLPKPVFENKTAEIYEGAEFTLLHPLYIMGRQMDDEFKTEFDERVDSIVVCFGGSDPANLTMRTVEALTNALRECIVHIVTGAGYAHLDELKQLLDKDKTFKFMHIHNLPSLNPLLSGAKLAIISGGTLLYECCATGTPALTICQNQEQSDEADLFAAKGTAFNLGVHSNVSIPDITIEAAKLMMNEELLSTMNKAGEGLIDGAGIVRSWDAIIKRYKTEIK